MQKFLGAYPRMNPGIQRFWPRSGFPLSPPSSPPFAPCCPLAIPFEKKCLQDEKYCRNPHLERFSAVNQPKTLCLAGGKFEEKS